MPMSIPPQDAAQATGQFDPGQLADIRIPEAVTFWPVAPGWWILLTLIVLLIILIIYLIKREPKESLPTNKELKIQALMELNTIRTYYKSQASHDGAHETVKKISIFLRRYTLSLYQRDRVASLTDEQWLSLLDDIIDKHSTQSSDAASKPFSNKFSTLLIENPYQSVHAPIDAQLLAELFSASELMIKYSFKYYNAKSSVQGNKPHV